MDVRKICMNCLEGTLNERGVCDKCQQAEQEIRTRSNHLPFRTILKGKYLVGKVIGEGGFAVTYLGYDLDLEIKVAIKEFCPGQMAGRERTKGLDVLPFNKDVAETFMEEQEKFINEAKRLAKFRNKNGIVSVLDYFKENNTAYIVMDYIDGVTLKQYCKMLNAPMKYDELLTLLHPVILALKEIHQNGIIHRDISADNIMITRDKKNAYLIDFGTARETQSETPTGYSKSFYTPWEQTTQSMKQGPWTDVYAMCATIYYCTTGRHLPKIVDRLANAEIVTYDQLQISIPPHIEATLVEGLALHPDSRIRSMEELEQKLYKEVKYSANSVVEGINTVAEATANAVVSDIPGKVVTNVQVANTVSDGAKSTLTQEDKEIEDAWETIKRGNAEVQPDGKNDAVKGQNRIIISFLLVVGIIALIIWAISSKSKPERIEGAIIIYNCEDDQIISVENVKEYLEPNASMVTFKDEKGESNTRYIVGTKSAENRQPSYWESIDVCYSCNGKKYIQEVKLQVTNDIIVLYDMYVEQTIEPYDIIGYLPAGSSNIEFITKDQNRRGLYITGSDRAENTDSTYWESVNVSYEYQGSVYVRELRIQIVSNKLYLVGRWRDGQTITAEQIGESLPIGATNIVIEGQTTTHTIGTNRQASEYTDGDYQTYESIDVSYEYMGEIVYNEVLIPIDKIDYDKIKDELRMQLEQKTGIKYSENDGLDALSQRIVRKLYYYDGDFSIEEVYSRTIAESNFATGQAGYIGIYYVDVNEWEADIAASIIEMMENGGCDWIYEARRISICIDHGYRGSDKENHCYYAVCGSY